MPEIDLKSWISLIGLFVTVLSLLAAQLKSNKIQKEAAETAKKAERRLELKLRIFQILIGPETLDMAEITQSYNARYPSDTISNEELHKSIYEMLVDGTIVSYEDGTFCADTVDEDEEDEDPPQTMVRSGKSSKGQLPSRPR